MARFIYECPMRWADLDAQGHVNNAKILTYLEQGRIAAFYDATAVQRNRGRVIVRHEIDYLRPIFYQSDPLHMELWVSDVGAARFTVHSEISVQGKLAVRALSTMVTIVLDSGKPARLEPDDRTAVLSFADDLVTS